MNIIADTIGSVAGQVVGSLDDLFTSEEERKAAEFKVQQLLMQPQILQAMTTLKEAEHASVFVAGWRPALGWIAAMGLGWEYIARPITASFLHMLSVTGKVNPAACIQAAADLPHLDTAQLMTLVTILLGIAGYRTFEKTKGVDRKTIK